MDIISISRRPDSNTNSKIKWSLRKKLKIISNSGLFRPNPRQSGPNSTKWFYWAVCVPEITVWRSLIESKSNILRIILAESLGTFVLVFVGIGGALQCSKYSKEKTCSSIHGPLAGGLGAALGIYIGANASGGHANPAVTIAFAVLGRLGNGFRIWI